MKHVTAPCVCNSYIEGTPCAGGPRAFMRSELVGDSVKWGRYCKSFFDEGVGQIVVACWCYSFDPETEPVCLPPDGKVLSPQEFDDCTDCQSQPVPPSGGGGTDGGGGGGSGGGGLPPFGTPTAAAWEATICEDQGTIPAYVPTTLWAIPIIVDPLAENRTVPDGSYYFRSGGYCYSVTKVGDGTRVHDWVSFDPDYYESCPDCIGGRQAFLCAGQEASEAPDVWVRARHLPLSTPQTFKHERWCYTVTPGPNDIIPPDVDIVTPTYEYEACLDCVTGIMATVCDGQKLPDEVPQLWIAEVDIPPETYWFKFQGICYEANPASDRVTRPKDAIPIAPPSQYADCATCICGPALEAMGIQAQLCPDQIDAPLAPQLWVLEAKVKPGLTVFRHDRFCYVVRSNWQPQKLPPGAITINPVNAYESCYDCLSDKEDDNCPPGQHWDGIKCINDDPDDPHTCIEGFHWDEEQQKCVQDETGPVCPEGSHWNGFRCVPDDGPGGSTDCGPGFVWDAALERCVPGEDSNPPISPPPPSEPPKDPPTPPETPSYPATVVRHCDTNEIAGGILKTYGLARKVIGRMKSGDEGCDCYIVTTVGTNDTSFTVDPETDLVYGTCIQCRANCTYVRFAVCGSEEETDFYVNVLHWMTRGGGRHIAKIGDVCYRVIVPVHYTFAEVVANEGSFVRPAPEAWFSSCEDASCLPPVDCCEVTVEGVTHTYSPLSTIEDFYYEIIHTASYYVDYDGVTVVPEPLGSGYLQSFRTGDGSPIDLVHGTQGQCFQWGKANVRTQVSNDGGVTWERAYSYAGGVGDDPDYGPNLSTIIVTGGNGGGGGGWRLHINLEDAGGTQVSWPDNVGGDGYTTTTWANDPTDIVPTAWCNPIEDVDRDVNLEYYYELEYEYDPGLDEWVETGRSRNYYETYHIKIRGNLANNDGCACEEDEGI